MTIPNYSKLVELNLPLVNYLRTYEDELVLLIHLKIERSQWTGAWDEFSGI